MTKEEVDWDSLEREIDAEEKAKAKKEVVKVEKEKVEGKFLYVVLHCIHIHYISYFILLCLCRIMCNTYTYNSSMVTYVGGSVSCYLLFLMNYRLFELRSSSFTNL